MGMEIRKDDVIEKEEKEDVIDVNVRVDEQETDDDAIGKEEKEDGKETRTDNIIKNEEQEDVIDLNEREVERQKDDAEISVIDDCKNLEVGKNDNIEIIGKEEKEDGKETRSDNVIENEEQEDVFDLNGREVEQQTDDAEKSDNLEVEKNYDMEKKTDDVIEKEEKADVIDVKLETGNNDDLIEKVEMEDDMEVITDDAIEEEVKIEI